MLKYFHIKIVYLRKQKMHTKKKDYGFDLFKLWVLYPEIIPLRCETKSKQGFLWNEKLRSNGHRPDMESSPKFRIILLH